MKGTASGPDEIFRINVIFEACALPLLAEELRAIKGNKGRPIRLCQLATLGVLYERSLLAGARPYAAPRGPGEQEVGAAAAGSTGYRRCLSACELAALLDEDDEQVPS